MDDVLKTVEGIGYYRRFRFLKRGAEQIVNEEDGRLPETYEGWSAIPGVGKYTAAAIMAIAFDEPHAATDGNVIRVIARERGIDRDMRKDKNKRIIQTINQAAIEQADPAVYMEAIMELGATICTPKRPSCGDCPLNGTCIARKKTLQDVLPVMGRRKPPEVRHKITLIVRDDDGHVHLVRQTEAMLGGMYLFPQFEGENIQTVLDDLREEGIRLRHPVSLGTKKHVFSHRIWKMEVHAVRLQGRAPDHWMSIDETTLNDYPMPVAHQKVTELMGQTK
jgi:A/G-specific adenine glycosylase